MLDFYLISDDIEDPEFPEQIGLLLAGGLDDKTFTDLKLRRIIEENYNFYSDFRWTKETVKQKYDLTKLISHDSSVKKMIDILSKAVEQERGLIAFCD